MKRSFLTGLFAGSFLFLPFIVTAAIGVALIFVYEKYWPTIVVAALSDALFVGSGGGYFHIYFFFTICSIFLYVLSDFVRKRLWKEA